MPRITQQLSLRSVPASTLLLGSLNSLMLLSACKDPCGNKVRPLQDIDEPVLCDGEIRFVNHRIQLNLASSVSSEATEPGVDDDPDAEETPPPAMMAEAAVTIEAHTSEGRGAEFANVIVEFLGENVEDAQQLVSIEPGENCRGGGRRVSCTMDADGLADLSLRSTGLVPSALGQSEVYHLFAYSGAIPDEESIEAGSSQHSADIPSSSESGEEPGLVNWDAANVEVTLGLADAEIVPLGFSESVLPSAGQLGCSSTSCPQDWRSQKLAFALSRDGAILEFEPDERLTLEVSLSGTSVAWLAHEGLGCGAHPSSSLSLSYIGASTYSVLICFSGAGGEVTVSSRVLAFLPAERLPSVWSEVISVMPDVSSLTLTPSAMTLPIGSTESVEVQAFYCDSGAEHELQSSALSLLTSGASIQLGCVESESCSALSTDQFGRAEFTVTRVADGDHVVTIKADSKDGDCEVQVNAEGE